MKLSSNAKKRIEIRERRKNKKFEISGIIARRFNTNKNCFQFLAQWSDKSCSWISEPVAKSDCSKLLLLWILRQSDTELENIKLYIHKELTTTSTTTTTTTTITTTTTTTTTNSTPNTHVSEELMEPLFYDDDYVPQSIQGKNSL